MNGSVTDDGLPTGQPPSIQWTKQSGPGAVTFSSANSAATSATFSQAGTYVLRLSASDSILNTSDEVVVTVYPLTTVCPNDDFTDDFNDNSLDAAKWLISEPASSVTVREQNQRLEIALLPNTIAYNGVSSAGKFDFRGKRFEVNVPQTTNHSGFTETFITLVRDSNNYYLILAGSGSLALDGLTNGVRDRSVFTYNSTAHRFWRLRHDTAANAIHFETGSDGFIWTKRKTVAVTFPLTAMTANLFAGAWGSGNGAPGMAVFDNVRLVPLVPNCLPSVELTSPANNAIFASGSNIGLSAGAFDSDGQIAKVEFFTNGVKLGEVTTAPYNFLWNNVAAGSYAIQTKATDNGGATATSAVVQVMVNQPPTANASSDQTITLPAVANLQGAATDDGRPANILTIAWSKVSGPGNVAFGNAGAATTTATFDTAGTYVLRLTASDTDFTTSDDVQVIVNPVPANQAPAANAGPDLSVAINGNLIVNGGNEEQPVSGEITGWTEVQGTNWTQGTANTSSGFPEAQRGTAYFFASDAPQAELRQDVDVSAFATNIPRLLKEPTVLLLPNVSGFQQTDSDLIKAFVEQGGVVVAFGPQIPMGRTYERKELFGVDEAGGMSGHTAVRVNEAVGARVKVGSRFALQKTQLPVWTLNKAKVIATFEDNSAAVVANRFGKGMVVSFFPDAWTAARDFPELTRDVIDYALSAAGAESMVDIIGANENVDIVVGKTSEGFSVAVVNHDSRSWRS